MWRDRNTSTDVDLENVRNLSFLACDRGGTRIDYMTQ